MINDFIYDIPVKVYFGKDQLKNLAPELNKYGKRVLMVYGGGSIKRTGLYDRVVKAIKDGGLELFELPGVKSNPRIDSVREGARICKENNIDVLLAVGGGSTIDCTKWIGAAACVDFDPWDFFNEKWAPVEKALPVLDILTLAATGSEMDCGGVISNPETHDKVGRMEMPLMPKVSFLDPTNTFTVPAYQTACGSADMMSHIMEVYFNMNDDFDFLDSFMEGMMRDIIKYAPIALAKPDDYKARAELMWVGTWAINGFVNGGKQQAWSCHPMEHEVSAIYDITHGLGLAILTPRWMEYTLDDTTVDKFVQYAENVFGIHGDDKMEVAKKGIEALKDFLYNKLGLKSTFPEVGITDESNFEIMAEKAVKNGFTMNAFKPLAKEDIVKIFQMCMK